MNLRLLVILIFTAAKALATPGIFLESFWSNQLTNSGTAVWAGGNYADGPNGAPRSTTGLCLLESAIGQLTAQTVGYPAAISDLRSFASNERRGAAAYRYTTVGGIAITNPAVTWNLVFPGAYNSVDGSTHSGGMSDTYHADQLDSAERTLRALLRQNPFDADAGKSLVLLCEERMLPWAFSGSQAVSYASKARLLGRNPDLVELPALDKARSYFRAACDIFSVTLANPADAILFEGVNPFVSAAVTNEVARVLDAYLRTLADYGETSFRYYQLRHFADFRDPARNQPPPQDLLNDLDAVRAEIQLRLLLASPFSSLPVYTFSAAGRVRSGLRELGRLYESIVQGRITFIAGSESGEPGHRYGEFTTAFIPIFAAESFSGSQSSFDVAHGLANSFVVDAIAAEDKAKKSIDTVLDRKYDFRTAQASLEIQYMRELLDLCGYYASDSQGKEIPDFFFAALPPGERENRARALLNGVYPLTTDHTGAIYRQWKQIDTALTELDLARLDLENTLKEMEMRQEVAEKIASGQRRIAGLILTNGETVAGLEIKRGEIHAEATFQTANINAQAAQQKAETSGMLGILGSVPSFVTNPAQGFSQYTGAMTSLANGYEDAAASLAIGQVQARSARQLADINVQITRISASERAEMQYEQANETMLRLSEALNSLRLQADSQSIRLRLAAQHVDRERDQLSTMLARVAYLLRQWARSADLLTQNPALSNDLLIERDADTRRAEESFILAQQWAFLAAQAFEYRDNCPESSATNRLVHTILATRNAADLKQRLNEINSASAVLAATCQNSVTFKPARFSVRNNFVQANVTEGAGTNLTFLSYEPTLAGGNAAASDAAWVEYLRDRVRTNQFGQRILVLEFSTALMQRKVRGIQRNPLFECALFGATIFSGTDRNNSQHKGVQLSLTTKGFTPPLGANEGYRIQLSQIGLSSIRRQAFGNLQDPVRAIRYFNFGAAFAANFTAASNSLDANPGTAAFNERSPANDRWQLVIISGDSENNAALLNNLDRLADIELRLSFRGFIDARAAQNCTN